MIKYIKYIIAMLNY